MKSKNTPIILRRLFIFAVFLCLIGNVLAPQVNGSYSYVTSISETCVNSFIGDFQPTQPTSTDSTVQTEPTETTEHTDSTEATEPTASTEASEQTVSTEPSEQAVSTKAPEQTVYTEASEQAVSTEASEQTASTESSEQANSTEAYAAATPDTTANDGSTPKTGDYLWFNLIFALIGFAALMVVWKFDQSRYPGSEINRRL